MNISFTDNIIHVFLYEHVLSFYKQEKSVTSQPKKEKSIKKYKPAFESNKKGSLKRSRSTGVVKKQRHISPSQYFADDSESDD